MSAKVHCAFCNDPSCDLPPCSCGEDHALSPEGRCRDCDVRHQLDSMQCSVCMRMRYRTDPDAARFGRYLWGEPCACDPQPPSVAEAAI